MKKRTVFAVLLIFLFALSLLTVGLNISELGLREVSGGEQPPGALTIRHHESEGWVFVFAGREFSLPKWWPGQQ
jgi:hypothetical protein